MPPIQKEELASGIPKAPCCPSILRFPSQPRGKSGSTGQTVLWATVPGDCPRTCWWGMGSAQTPDKGTWGHGVGLPDRGCLPLHTTLHKFPEPAPPGIGKVVALQWSLCPEQEKEKVVTLAGGVAVNPFCLFLLYGLEGWLWEIQVHPARLFCFHLENVRWLLGQQTGGRRESRNGAFRLTQPLHDPPIAESGRWFRGLGFPTGSFAKLGHLQFLSLFSSWDSSRFSLPLHTTCILIGTSPWEEAFFLTDSLRIDVGFEKPKMALPVIIK